MATRAVGYGQSMSARMFPPEFVVPTTVVDGRFRVRPLVMEDLARDYQAYMGCVEYLRYGGFLQPPDGALFDWPTPDITIRWALVLLAEIEFSLHYGQRVEYGIFDLAEREEFGCLYVLPSLKAGYDAQVTMWVRQDVHDELDALLFEHLRGWVPTAFPMLDRIVFPGRELSWPEWSALPDSGTAVPGWS